MIHAFEERTGEGQWVDLAMTEAATTLNGPTLLDYAVNGRKMRRPGMPHSNRSQQPRMAPHGIYPARGDDEWVAIACPGDAEWNSLADCIGRDWCSEARFRDLEGRLAHEDELDGNIAKWTAEVDKFEIQQRLLALRIPAAAVQRPTERMDEDANTEAWGLWPTVEHKLGGRVRVDGLPVHLSETDWQIREPGPLLGEHNERVYGQLLGKGAAELEELRGEGVI